MTTSLAVARPDGGTTTVTVTGVGPPVLLAPGAGAGHGHPFLAGLGERLAAGGFRVHAFDYPYQEAGRRAPDRMERLVACHRAVYAAVAASGTPPFLVGKSMGGRVGSHLGVAAPGWVFLGYPLLPTGKTEPRDVSHLALLGAMLFVQGERDALAPLPMMRRVVARLPGAELAVVPGADHSFRSPGVDLPGTLDHLAGVVLAWLRRRAGQPPAHERSRARSRG